MTRHSVLVAAIAGRLVAKVVAGMVIIGEESLDRFISERDAADPSGSVDPLAV